MKVYTQGSFDLFHYGHVRFLERCSHLGEVDVYLLSDKAYEKYRGYKPTMNYGQRYEMVEGCAYVDLVYKCEDPKDIAKDYKQYGYVALGSDWAKKDIYKQYGMKPEELNPYLVYFPYTKGISSSCLKSTPPPLSPDNLTPLRHDRGVVENTRK